MESFFADFMFLAGHWGGKVDGVVVAPVSDHFCTTRMILCSRGVAALPSDFAAFDGAHFDETLRGGGMVNVLETSHRNSKRLGGGEEVQKQITTASFLFFLSCSFVFLVSCAIVFRHGQQSVDAAVSVAFSLPPSLGPVKNLRAPSRL